MDHISSRKARKERAQLSCTFCRNRKLKCDRQQPCENCVKRNQSCHYATPAAHRIGKASDGNSSAIQNRIQHLEGLVLSLMQDGKPSNGSSVDSEPSPESTPDHGLAATQSNESETPDSKETETALKSFGMMNVEDNASTKYVGNDHWQAILQDINEVKSHFADSQLDAEDESSLMHPARHGPELLVGLAGPYNRTELLASLPDRATCDSVVSKYLNSAEPLTVVFHRKTFQAEYERFWRDRHAAPANWVSMLYSILSITTYWQTRNLDQSPQEMAELRERIDFYRRQACKCLVFSGYMNPKKYAIESFLMYLGTEYTRSHNLEASLWVIFGLAVRLAISMGYHRDPSYFPRISAFHGEMRRRTWAAIAQLDILTSVQVGFPRMVRDVTTDTKLPGNYQDEDLSEDMQELPPERPHTEYTKLSYGIMKGRLVRVLGVICDQNGETDPTVPYGDIINLDQRLRDTYNGLPEVLRMKPMKNAIGDKPSLIMRRINLELVYLKARCILHRKYLTAFIAKPASKQYEFSRAAAINAATTILRHQVMLDTEIRTGGRLSDDKWLISALTTNDFTLAAMMICMDLDYRTSERSLESTHSVEEDQYQLLERSYGIWKLWFKQGIATPKAKIALDVLLIMLEKVRKMKAAKNSQHNSPINGSNTAQTNDIASNRTEPSRFETMEFEQYTFPSSNHSSHNFVDTSMNDSLNSNFGMTPESNSDDSSVPSAVENQMQTWMAAPQDMAWTQWDEMFMPANAGPQEFEDTNWGGIPEGPGGVEMEMGGMVNELGGNGLGENGYGAGMGTAGNVLPSGDPQRRGNGNGPGEMHISGAAWGVGRIAI